MNRSSLTDPDRSGPERLRAARQRIVQAIEAASGRAIGFDQFMEIALYDPHCGYYAAGEDIFGTDGDFVTAPGMGRLFGACLADVIATVLRGAGGRVIEYGPGTGALAAQLLPDLEGQLGDELADYILIERAAGLIARQRETLAPLNTAVQPRWLEHADAAGGTSVVVANELLDAFAARRFCVTDSGVAEMLVTCEQDEFAWTTIAGERVPQALQQALANHPEGYITEQIIGIEDWLQDLAGVIDRGLVLVVDYGYPRHEILHRDRTGGTLRCHYRHQAHADPFLYPGLQDMTTSVDFTALATAAGNAGFDLLGYTTLTRFLVDAGLERIMQNHLTGNPADDYALAQEAKRLLLPGEMGQTFKVMALGRGGVSVPPGFNDDLRHALSAFEPGTNA